ncbi:MAG: hypothetical protein K1X94_00570 [Sandaracinaceae bacterium]|nr:hypothetical protein [Sandaracinaceae bacterium]
MHSERTWVVVGLLTLWCACAPSERTLTLRIQSDVEPYEEGRSVTVEVFREALPCGSLEGRPITTASASIDPGDGDALRGGTFTVDDVRELADGIYTLRATLFRPASSGLSRGAPLIERCVVVTVAGDRVVRIPLTASCHGIQCPTDGGDPAFDQCLNGRCVDPRCNVDDPSTRPHCCDPSVADCASSPSVCSTSADCTSHASCAMETSCSGGACVITSDTCTPELYCDIAAGRCLRRSFTGDAGIDAGAPPNLDAAPSDDAVADAWLLDAGPRAPALADDLAAGARHACAIRAGRGDVVCWGADNEGELGRGVRPPGAAWANLVPGLTGVQQLALGDELSCALRAGEVWCWGRLPGALTSTSTPTVVPGLTDIVEITAGAAHACARHGAGTVSCWGWNADGALGDGTNDNHLAPVPVVGLTGVTGLARGPTAKHTCALDGDRLWCWGDNEHGQLGDGTTRDSYLPTAVAGLTGVRAASVGFQHTCAATDSAVWCWGSSARGETGAALSGPNVEMPRSQEGLETGMSLGLGSYESCLLTSDGGVSCWGERSLLGVTISELGRTTAAPVPMLAAVEQLAVGSGWACARTATSIWCWGDRVVAGAPDASGITPTEIAGFP